MPVVRQDLQKIRRTHQVGFRVVPDPVHRIAYAHGSRKEEHRVHSRHCFPQRGNIPQIHLGELRRSIQILRRLAFRMDLGVQVVGHPHCMPLLKQGVHGVRPDEPCAADHQDLHQFSSAF